MAIVLFWGLLTAAYGSARNGGDPYRTGVNQYYRGQYEVASASFVAAIHEHADDPMPHLMLSRTCWHLKDRHRAYREATRALADIASASDEEQYLINAWVWRMQSEAAGQARPEAANAAQDKAIWNADYGIAMYPDSADLYILRGDLTTTAIRQAPYYLAALNLDPSNPLQQSWVRPHIPFPVIRCGPGHTFNAIPQPRLFTGLGKVHHLITTRNPLAQKYFDQGLCEMYAYVTPYAARSFKYAAQLDPHCPMAFWGISMAADNPDRLAAAERAWALARRYGNAQERWYCAARVLQLQPGHVGACVDALAAAIEAYPRDPDLWIWRGTLQGFAGEDPNTQIVTAGMPFVLAAWHVQPDHPAANHELIHAYESINRPLLGWKYSWGFRHSAPNMPHAQHMQAHLAMRLGRWAEALQCTRASVRLSRAGYPELDTTHHMNVYLWALVHEGCFHEATTQVHFTDHGEDLAFARLYRMELDFKAMAAWATDRRRHNFIDGYYVGALADLQNNDVAGAQQALTHLHRARPTWYGVSTGIFTEELQGRIAMAQHRDNEGVRTLELLARRQDLLAFSCRWGQGSYYDELWGEAALAAGQLKVAREAFSEALAHEHGSILGALGLQVVAELQHRSDLAVSYAGRARSIWKRADPGSVDRLLGRLRAVASDQSPVL